MEPVLPFQNVPYDKSVEDTGDISNMSAEEYFSWVRDQSSKMPAFFRASDDVLSSIAMVGHTNAPTMFPMILEIPECPVSLLPSANWEREVIHSFSELRSTISTKSEQFKERVVTVPQMKDKKGWLMFCLGLDTPKDCTDSELGFQETLRADVKKRKREVATTFGIDLYCEETDQYILEVDHQILDPSAIEEDEAFPVWEGCKGVDPTFKLLLQFDQVLTQKVLMYLIEHLEGEDNISRKTGEWIYSLLARVEKPLHRDVVALIRQLYRCCCKMRCRLDQNVDSNQLATLNTMISISGYYFGQGEYYKSFDPIVEANSESENAILEESSAGSVGDSDSQFVPADEQMDDEEDLHPNKWRTL